MQDLGDAVEYSAAAGLRQEHVQGRAWHRRLGAGDVARLAAQDSGLGRLDWECCTLRRAGHTAAAVAEGAAADGGDAAVGAAHWVEAAAAAALRDSERRRATAAPGRSATGQQSAEAQSWCCVTAVVVAV